MLNTAQATRGMVVAPHALATQTGVAILREGGNAIEAAIGMAATLSVVYPHMTGIGGDSFWLIGAPGDEVFSIDASGRAAVQLNADHYMELGMAEIPTRGPLAANTVAGTLSGWQVALEHGRQRWGGTMTLDRLLQDAIAYAEQGCPVTQSQARSTAHKLSELKPQSGFAGAYLGADGSVPAAGSVQCQPALATTLRHLAMHGLDDFYRGDLARLVAAELAAAGSPLTLADLEAHHAEVGTPLKMRCGSRLPEATLYAVGPPTQGLATLLILGQYAYAEQDGSDEVDYVHQLVEATKQAFRQRDKLIRDPDDMLGVDLDALLTPEALGNLAKNIDMQQAGSWAGPGDTGDTTWFGVIDADGRSVSCIQSIYHEFGSGIVLPSSGICWQNRGSSFSLDASHPRYLRGGRKPFHTLCPSLARFDDGRTMVFGTMGGDGQPQTQAALFTRYAAAGYSLQQAISAPRWLLGRTWGDSSNSLKLEGRFGGAVAEALRARGHIVEQVAEFDEMMGHAGAVVRRPDGVFEGAADPRSDGAAAGY